MTDMMVRQHQGSFHIDEGYISSDLSSSPRSPASEKCNNTKQNHQNPRALHNKFTQSAAASNLAQLNESLMQELSVSHMDRDNLMAKVDQLEDELHTMDLKNEALGRENQELGDRIQVVSIRMSNFEQKASDGESRKAQLESQNNALLHKKKQLEIQLQINDENLSSVLQRAKEAEAAMAAGISRIDRLSRELEQLSSNEHHSLEDYDDEGKERLRRHGYTKEIMEEELQRLTEAVAIAKQEIGNASKMIDMLRDEGDVIKEQNQKLEVALTTAQRHCRDLERQEVELADKISTLNNEVRTLAVDEDSDTDIAAATAISRVPKGATGFEKDYIILRDSIWKLLEVLKEKQLRISKLENQLFAAGDNKKALEVQVRRLSTASVEVSKNAKEEVTRTRQKIAELTEALELNEANVLQLQTELEATKKKLKRNKQAVSDYGLPMLAASTSLAAVGMYVYFSSKRG